MINQYYDKDEKEEKKKDNNCRAIYHSNHDTCSSQMNYHFFITYWIAEHIIFSVVAPIAHGNDEIINFLNRFQSQTSLQPKY